MAEDEAIFEPKLTDKKKKKKKTGFSLEAAQAEAGGDTTADATNGVENGNDDVVDDSEFLGKAKKKKSKKKPFNFDELNDVLDSATSAGGAGEEANEEAGEDDASNIEMHVEFDYTSKKKKNKKKVDIGKLIAEDEKDAHTDDRETDDAWGDSERDYSYDELLQRAFDQLRLKNPEMADGKKKRFIMKPPHVLRIGSKKSAFVNFSHICRLLHRVPQHVLQFLLAELGTSGSIDGNCQLIIKGRFQQKQIENVLRRYIKEYVTCHTCRSSDTILQKDARLYFLQCEQCNSRCSVAPIKSGFQAVANKQQRQAIRASKN